MKHALLLLATLAGTACDSGALNRTAEAAAANDPVIGVWNARFRLDEPLIKSESFLTKDIEGEIAFVRNRSVSSLSADLPAPSAYGTYDVDFSPF